MTGSGPTRFVDRSKDQSQKGIFLVCFESIPLSSHNSKRLEQNQITKDYNQTRRQKVAMVAGMFAQNQKHLVKPGTSSKL